MTHSAYHVYDLEIKKFIISRDVTFVEHVFPFQLLPQPSSAPLVLPVPIPDFPTPLESPSTPFGPTLSPHDALLVPLSAWPRRTMYRSSYFADYVSPTLPSTSSITPFTASVTSLGTVHPLSHFISYRNFSPA